MTWNWSTSIDQFPPNNVWLMVYENTVNKPFTCLETTCQLQSMWGVLSTSRVTWFAPNYIFRNNKILLERTTSTLAIVGSLFGDSLFLDVFGGSTSLVASTSSRNPLLSGGPSAKSSGAVDKGPRNICGPGCFRGVQGRTGDQGCEDHGTRHRTYRKK